MTLQATPIVSKRSPQSRRNGVYKQAGFTAVELTVVIVGILLLSAIGFGLYEQFVAGTGTKKVGDFYQNKTAKLRTAYANQSTWAGVTNADTVARHIFTDVDASGNPLNPYGGTLAISAVNFNATNDGLKIIDSTYTTDQCLDAVQQVEQLFGEIDVAGTAVKPKNGTLNATTMNAQCSSAANVAITWFLTKN
jgi:Tfp pilus assembly protein PilE